MFNAEQHPHRRYNLLTGSWVLVSPHRTQRPWQGQEETAPPAAAAPYDPECYLCPGNWRAGGVRNPDYSGVFGFDNDFPSLLPRDFTSPPGEGLLVSEAERGICRVLCFSPRHDLTLARMDRGEIRLVVDAWCEESRNLGGLDFVRYVQIFENRGQMMGASNPHPHCQIWASEHVPNEPAIEQRMQQDFMAARGRCLLCVYTTLELLDQRLIYENSSFAVVVPFWAVWPFETLLISKRHMGAIQDLTAPERDDLSDALQAVATRYDNLFEAPFPYSMGFHQRPDDGEPHPEWHLHAHFYPPLLRSASIRKFMVGYEMLATPQRDLTPESAAERLRSVSAVHYLKRKGA